MVKTARIFGLDIEYFDKGEGPVLVFAHGLGGNCRQWSGQINEFEDFRVIAFSLQGHGDSSMPLDYDYTIENYTKVIKALLDHLSIDDCSWVGNSMGGVLGYSLKARGFKINHLITNGCTPALEMGRGTLKLIKLMDKLLIRIMGFDGYIRFASKHVSQLDHVKAMSYDLFIKSQPETIISSHQVLGDYNFLDLVDKNCHFIINPLDKDINKYLEKYKEVVVKAKTYTLDNSGHVANMELPEAYNSIIKDILKNA